MHPPAPEAAVDSGAAVPELGGTADFAAPEFRILIFAPVGRTAELARQTLDRAGLASAVCAGMDELCAALREGAGARLARALGDYRRACRLGGAR